MKIEEREMSTAKEMELYPNTLLITSSSAVLTTTLQYSTLIIFLLIGFYWKWQGLAHLEPVLYHRASYEALNYSDIIALYLRDGRASHNLIPYIQQTLEYPVLTGLVIWLASFAGSAQGYFAVNAALLGACAVISLWLVRRMSGSQAWMWAAAPALLWYGGLNWDLLSICPMLAAIYLARYKQRPGWAGVLLAIAIWSKFFPIVLVVAFALYFATQRQWRALFQCGLATLGVSLALNLPVLLLSPKGWTYFFYFSQHRPIEAGLWFLLGRHLSIGAVNTASLLLFLGIIGAVCAWFGWRGWQRRGIADPALVALLLLCAWFSLNKVYSPQYMLWLVALVAVVGTPGWVYALLCCLDAAYYMASFQTLYFVELVNRDSASVAGSAILQWQFHSLHDTLTLLRLGIFVLLFGVTLWQGYRFSGYLIKEGRVALLGS